MNTGTHWLIAAVVIGLVIIWNEIHRHRRDVSDYFEVEVTVVNDALVAMAIGGILLAGIIF